MNPIKSPTEMLYNEVGLPHMAGGGAAAEAIAKLAPGAEQLFKSLSKKLSSVLGRAPTPEELQQLQHEIHGLSAPTSTMEGANLARVAKQEPHANMFADQEGRLFPPTAEGKMPTPGQRQYTGDMAFDPRDEFLTYANTGRTNKGTYLNIAPDAEQALMVKANEFSPNGDTGGRIDINEMAEHLQNKGVPHDYTGMGQAVFGNRPDLPATTLTKAQRAELEAWREQARNSGMSEDAIMSAPSRLGKEYKYLEEERGLGQAGPEASMGGYAAGGEVEEGLGTVGFMPRLKSAAGKYLGHGLNVGLGAMSIPEIKKALQASQYGKAAGQTTDLASAFLPMLPYGIYEGGKHLSEMATNNLANRPEFNKQMEAATSDPMGGAMGGDYSLATAILNARNK